MDAGDVDCGPNRGSCPAGKVCMKSPGCMPPDAVECGSGHYCDNGTTCRYGTCNQ